MNILGIDFEDWFHPELIQKAEFKVEKAVSYTHLTLPTTPYV